MVYLPKLEKLRKDIHSALRAWAKAGGSEAHLLQYLLLVQAQLAKQESGNTDIAASKRFATNQVLLNAVQELETQNEELARVIRMRFIENEAILKVANSMNISEHTVSRMQAKGISEIATILREREQKIRAERALRQKESLPAPNYNRLFGLEQLIAATVPRLLDDKEESPWIYSLYGIGGIGKTALADALTRAVIDHYYFDHVLWVKVSSQSLTGHSAPNTVFLQLIYALFQQISEDDGAAEVTHERRLQQVRHFLKTNKCLVIIDNLEAVEDVSYFLQYLNDLTMPSKLLLTTRVRLIGTTAVYNQSVEELSYEDAKALMQHHAQQSGITLFESAAEPDWQAIYETVGGNPLALKVVTGMLDALPLDKVMCNLKGKPTGDANEMYNRIYRQAWESLSEPARLILTGMPIISEQGAQEDYLQQMTELPDEQFWPAIQELRYLSLLEVSGNLQERRYSIHKLTETFLNSEIITAP